jgi:hypothetical protein
MIRILVLVFLLLGCSKDNLPGSIDPNKPAPKPKAEFTVTGEHITVEGRFKNANSP